MELFHCTVHWAQPKGHTCGFPAASHLIWYPWFLSDCGKFQPCKPYQEFLLYLSALPLDLPSERLRQPLLFATPGRPTSCGRAAKTDERRVPCKRLSDLALPSPHLSEFRSALPCGLSVRDSPLRGRRGRDPCAARRGQAAAVSGPGGKGSSWTPCSRVTPQLIHISLSRCSWEMPNFS